MTAHNENTKEYQETPCFWINAFQAIAPDDNINNSESPLVLAQNFQPFFGMSSECMAIDPKWTVFKWIQDFEIFLLQYVGCQTIKNELYWNTRNYHYCNIQ